MATFEERVEGLTGLTIDGTSSPTQSELSQFLKDGVSDVINRLLKVDRDAVISMGVVSSVSSTGTIIDGKILDAWGSDGTNEHPAQFVSTSIGRRSADSSSLHYRSKYNPCYYREGKRVVLKPDGGSVLHITYPSVTYDQSNIYNVPEQYLPLIMLYASFRSLDNALSAKSKTDLSITASIPVIPALTSTTVTLPTNIPVFVSPVSAATYTKIDTYIDVEEDLELANVKLQEMNLKVQEHQNSIQNQLNEFNAQNAEYQAELQKALTDAQLEDKGDDQKIQKFSSDVQRYQLEVQTEIQEWTTNFTKLQADYQWMQGRMQSLLQEYYASFASAAPAGQEERRG